MEKANFLTLMESRLPPGFRFHPKDDELVGDYLVRHVRTTTSSDIDSASSAAANYTSTGHGGGTNHHHHPHDQLPIMIEVDLNKCEPWELPPSARVGGKEYYFFSQRDRKYATGLRTNRATASGYWKATGKDRQVIRCNKLIGMRKTLVFYKGRAPKGKKTDWVMHEFRLEGTATPNPQFQLKEDWVLCRVFYKNRGVTTKSSTDHGYESETISSCSLMPQLVDHPSYNITTTNSTSHAEGVEQVPCFSNHLPPAPPPPPSAYKHMITTNYHHQQQQHHDQSSPHHFEGTTTSSGMFQFGENYGNSDDNAVIKAILDQLTKAEQHDHHHRHLGNIGSSNNVNININHAHLKGREAIMSSYTQPSISQGAAGYYSDLSLPKY